MTARRKSGTQWIVVLVERGIPTRVEVFGEFGKAAKKCQKTRAKLYPHEDEVVLFECQGAGVAHEIV